VERPSASPSLPALHLGRRFALLLGFGATQCPMFDYTCHDPNQVWGVWFFLAAVAI
jgi:hypothetical protein